MIHFGANQGAHNLVWGQRVTEPQDPEAEVFQAVALRSRPMTGQALGGLGMFRTASGHPQLLALSGAYLFDTYVTSYLYASGQYSLALQVQIALNEVLNMSDAVAGNLIIPEVLAEALSFGSDVAAGNLVGIVLSEQLNVRILE